MFTALSVAVPKHVIDRSVLGLDKVQLSNFERVTGIQKTRKYQGESSTALALEAVRPIKDLIRKHDVGAVVCVTQSQDRLSPAMAHDIAKEINLGCDCPVFDVNQSCTGFVYGMWLASLLVPERGSVLLVCVDRLRAREGLEALIFSDAAAACIVYKQQGYNGAFKFLTDPSGADKLHSDKEGFLCMKGGDVFDFVTKNIPVMIREEFETCDMLVQHQANLSMMKLVDIRSGFADRSIHTIREYGNMSMCSIPVAIAASNKELGGKSLVLAGYGAGWSAALTSIYWPEGEEVSLVEV